MEGNAASRRKKRNTLLRFAGDRRCGDPVAASLLDLAYDDRHCAYRSRGSNFPSLLKKAGEVGMYEDLLHQAAAADPRNHQDVRKEMKHKKTGVYDRSFA